MRFYSFVMLICLTLIVSVEGLEIIVVRHGETDWNKTRRFQGQQDIPLNAQGRRQAIAARSQFDKMHLDAVYCSDLLRARETARLLIDGRELEPHVDRRWGELCYGDFEGQPLHDADMDFFRECLLAPKSQQRCGVETLEAFHERLTAALSDVIKQHRADERVMIVAHNGVMRSLVETVMDNEAELPIRYGNCGYLVAIVDDNGRVRTLFSH